MIFEIENIYNFSEIRNMHDMILMRAASYIYINEPDSGTEVTLGTTESVLGGFSKEEADLEKRF